MFSNPWALVATGVVALALLAGSFGYGYYVATGQYEAALISQQQAIATAVHDKDAAMLSAATAAGRLVEERRKQGKAAAQAVMDAINALPIVTTPACEITPDALHLLNEAGRK